MNEVYIQIQVNGQWQTMGSTVNDPQFYTREMQTLQSRYPDKRVRVVDAQTGRLLDLL